MEVGFTAIKLGAEGVMALSTSEEPDLDVDALLPCLLIKRSEDAKIDEVVDMLKV